jgi:hypothetical protein
MLRSCGRYGGKSQCLSSAWQSVRLSNGRKKGEGNAKNGNRYLGWAFVEAAHFALRNCPQAKSFLRRAADYVLASLSPDSMICDLITHQDFLRLTPGVRQTLQCSRARNMA